MAISLAMWTLFTKCCELTVDLLIHLMCGHPMPHVPLNFERCQWPELIFPDVETVISFSPSATFLFYSLPVVDWLPRSPVSLNQHHPSFLPLVWFLSPQAGICVMSVDIPQSPEDSIDAKHSSVCQSKRTQSVLKDIWSWSTVGHQEPLLSKD